MAITNVNEGIKFDRNQNFEVNYAHAQRNVFCPNAHAQTKVIF